MPAAFLGHGSPMNALADNRYTQAWRRFGDSARQPRAVLVVSAHWYIDHVAVTAMTQPRTIHDFGGFPQALFDMQYPAPGSPSVAAEVAALLAPLDVELDERWGLDHGAWSVLVHAYPGADVPIVQLSIDASKPASFHYEVGARLLPLRDSGVVIVGSGNVVHNLRLYFGGPPEPYEWSVRFDQHVQRALDRRDHDALVGYASHPDGRLAVPTPDHYLPLLYIAAVHDDDEHVGVLVDGHDGASLSMRSIVIS